MAVGRELTKAHEELVVQPISRLIERFSEPKGEFTFLIPPQPPSSDSPQALPPIEDLRQELGRMAENGGVSRRAAVKTLADRYGMAVNELYELLRPQDDGGQKT
jgi:16S rRNA C1402 (ribose-2'-O) methylase RsmI